MRRRKRPEPDREATDQRADAHTGLDTDRPYNWSGSTVTGILDNKTYLGHMAGLRSTTLSYKNKKLIRHPETEQILVENTHEPLISQELWDIVQEVHQHKKRTPKHMESQICSRGLCSAPIAASRWYSTERIR